MRAVFDESAEGATVAAKDRGAKLSGQRSVFGQDSEAELSDCGSKVQIRNRMYLCPEGEGRQWEMPPEVLFW